MIGSVLKALDILDAFSPEEPRLSLAAISRRLGLPRSTAHNLVKTLHSRGFLEKVNADQYALGPAIIALTQAVRVNVELRDRAAPLLRELADECRESVYLTVPNGDQVLYIYAIESPRRLQARSAVGERFDYHCTAVGKALLAAFAPGDVIRLIERLGMPARTPATIVDLEALLDELAQTCERGFAIDRGENNRNIYCLAAPICDAQGTIIGACSLSGADAEIVAGRLPVLSQRLLITAEEISRRMGYVPAHPTQSAYRPFDYAAPSSST